MMPGMPDCARVCAPIAVVASDWLPWALVAAKSAFATMTAATGAAALATDDGAAGAVGAAFPSVAALLSL